MKKQNSKQILLIHKNKFIMITVHTQLLEPFPDERSKFIASSLIYLIKLSLSGIILSCFENLKLFADVHTVFTKYCLLSKCTK